MYLLHQFTITKIYKLKAIMANNDDIKQFLIKFHNDDAKKGSLMMILKDEKGSLIMVSKEFHNNDIKTL